MSLCSQRSLSYSDLQRQRNYFEYRYDERTLTYYLFNPITGEKILHTDYDNVDRSQSLWMEPTKPFFTATRDTVSSSVHNSIILTPPSYTSRQYGSCVYRRFRGWKNTTLAANHIVTVARGFLARLVVRNWIKRRYCKVYDPNTQLYYFQDCENLNSETSWYKPRFAYIDDIGTNNVLDAEDYLLGSKYSNGNILDGPYYKQTSVGKKNKARAIHHAFVPENEEKKRAVMRHSDIDLDKYPLGSVISWIDGSSVKTSIMTEYAFIRAAESAKDWSYVIHYMKQEAKNQLILIYGFSSFAKSFVPVDNSGLLHPNGEEVLDMCVEVAVDRANFYSATTKVFALLAMHNILSTTAGRTEYFNTSSITEMGEGRAVAIETFITKKIMVLNKFLAKIEFESLESLDGNQSLSKRPTRRSAELAEYSLTCLSDLANQNEYREQMAYLTAQPVLYAIKMCIEEAPVIIAGLRFLYHLCYRCESGQEAVRDRNVHQIFPLVRNLYSGDPEVMYQCRRLELSVQQDGWRGNVEDIIRVDGYRAPSQDAANTIASRASIGQSRNPLDELNIGNKSLESSVTGGTKASSIPDAETSSRRSSDASMSSARSSITHGSISSSRK